MAGVAERNTVVLDDLAVRITTFGSKGEARAALDSSGDRAARAHFAGATGKCSDFSIVELANGSSRYEFFAPADNPGFGKRYVLETTMYGTTFEYKDTIGPDGLIERKWIDGH